MLQYHSLDRRKVEFPGLFTMAGWLRQGRLPRSRHRDRAPHRQRALFQGATSTGLSNGLRLARALASPGERLRAAHQCLRSHDPRRHGKPSVAKDQPLNHSKTDSYDNACNPPLTIGATGAIDMHHIYAL